MIKYTKNSIIISTLYIDIEFTNEDFVVVRQDKEMYPDWHFSITDSTRKLSIHSCYCPEFRSQCWGDYKEDYKYNTIKYKDIEVSTDGDTRWNVENMLFICGESPRKVGYLPSNFTTSRYMETILKIETLFEKYEAFKLGKKFYEAIDI